MGKLILLLAMLAAQAQAGDRKGVWSLGGSFGHNTYAMTDINEALKNTGASITSGQQFGGNIAFGAAPGIVVGLGMDYHTATESHKNGGGYTVTNSFPMLSISLFANLVRPKLLPGLDAFLGLGFSADSLSDASTS